mmetsp:Transcript_7135/g.18476  ORF Transcript_7135/g.18476 Transcript_7135/m.18476 type:complete len:157 (-) Transcript_7135:276-746(-)
MSLKFVAPSTTPARNDCMSTMSALTTPLPPPATKTSPRNTSDIISVVLPPPFGTLMVVANDDPSTLITLARVRHNSSTAQADEMEEGRPAPAFAIFFLSSLPANRVCFDLLLYTVQLVPISHLLALGLLVTAYRSAFTTCPPGHLVSFFTPSYLPT